MIPTRTQVPDTELQKWLIVLTFDFGLIFPVRASIPRSRMEVQLRHHIVKNGNCVWHYRYKELKEFLKSQMTLWTIMYAFYLFIVYGPMLYLHIPWLNKWRQRKPVGNGSFLLASEIWGSDWDQGCDKWPHSLKPFYWTDTLDFLIVLELSKTGDI